MTVDQAEAQTCQTAVLNPGTTAGQIDSFDCVVQPFRNAPGELWRIAAVPGDRLTIAMSRHRLFDISIQDPFLLLLDPAGAPVASNDDFGGTKDARIEYVVAIGGVYTVVATSFASLGAAGERGVYNLSLEQINVAGVPGPPGQPTAQVSGNQVDLSWTTAATGSFPVIEYVLEAGTSTGGSELGVFPLGNLTRIVAAVGPGTYVVRVKARNAAGLGPASPERVFFVGPAPPPPPRTLQVAVIGNRVNLTWLAPVSGAPESYNLEVGSASGQTDVAVFPLAGNATTFSAENVPAGLYYVRLRAVAGGSVSAPSNELAILVLN
jgi:hypothetical protein